MRNKSFTLVELVIVVIVIGILASVAFPIYQNTIEAQKVKVDAVHLETAYKALEIYSMDHESMPGSLSEFPKEYLDKAYAEIFNQKDDWKIKLAYFIVNLQEKISQAKESLAYASSEDEFKKRMGSLRCPAAPSSCVKTYCLNQKVAGNPVSAFKALSGSEFLIVDCLITTNTANATFTTFPDSNYQPHKVYGFLTQPKTFAVGITVDKIVYKKGQIDEVVGQLASAENSSIGTSHNTGASSTEDTSKKGTYDKDKYDKDRYYKYEHHKDEHH